MTQPREDDTAPELTEHEKRLKRLRIRCWRRGTKEMDLLFGPFADGAMADLSQDDLDAFETLMNENDQDLYLWISGTQPVPAPLLPAVQMVRDIHKIA
ncbi:MAG: succinate dehydrogenase assembly factor 2 [Paracoccaceae bacterium]